MREALLLRGFIQFRLAWFGATLLPSAKRTTGGDDHVDLSSIYFELPTTTKKERHRRPVSKTRLLDVSSRRNPCHRVRYKRVNRVRLRTNSCRIFSNVTTKRCCISYNGYAALANKSPMTRPLDFRYFIADRINQRSELKRTN